MSTAIPTSPRVLAIDVGTSSARAILFDAAGRRVPDRRGQVHYEPRTTADGGVELDADLLLDAVAQAIDECLGDEAAAPAIDAVGISAFWHGLLALDADGRPLGAVLTWADTRAARAADELRDALDEDAVRDRIGTPIHASYFPAKLRWLRTADPRVLGRARRVGGFAEYLLWRLTGAWRTSVSMASGTGLLAHATLRWDPEMLDAAGVAREALVPIDDAPAALALPWASRWPALAGARWFPAWGDGACSNIGSDCAGPDRMALNVGTSAALRLVAPGRPEIPKGLWRYRVSAEQSIVGGATSEGGNVVAWCRRELALPADDTAFERAVAGVPPDGHGLVALPFLAGERSPGWRDDARGALTGMRLGTTAPEIARALMEAVAYRLATIHERLAPLAAPGCALIASGGALLRSEVWTGILADVLGVPLTLSSEDEASSRGAALLALARLGVELPAPAGVSGSVTPDPRRHEVYRRALERQHRLYEIVVAPSPS